MSAVAKRQAMSRTTRRVDILRSRPLPVGRALWSFVARNPDLATTVPVACALTLRPRDLPTRLRRQVGSDIAAVGNPTARHRQGATMTFDIAVLFRGTAIHGARSGHASGRVGMRILSSSTRSAFGCGLSPHPPWLVCARGASARVDHWLVEANESGRQASRHRRFRERCLDWSLSVPSLRPPKRAQVTGTCKRAWLRYHSLSGAAAAAASHSLRGRMYCRASPLVDRQPIRERGF